MGAWAGHARPRPSVRMGCPRAAIAQGARTVSLRGRYGQIKAALNGTTRLGKPCAWAVVASVGTSDRGEHACGQLRQVCTLAAKAVVHASNWASSMRGRSGQEGHVGGRMGSARTHPAQEIGVGRGRPSSGSGTAERGQYGGGLMAVVLSCGSSGGLREAAAWGRAAAAVAWTTAARRHSTATTITAATFAVAFS